ncbi:MAG: hypothetical protein ACW99G_18245 [Candidatus Thorarchaeota archaeon]|jgi:hypothetical protein
MPEFFALFLAGCMLLLVGMLAIGCISLVVGMIAIGIHNFFSSLNLKIHKKLENIIL